MQYFSIIIPTINESLSIEHSLQKLIPLIKEGHEIIVVDGGSEDETISICKTYTDKVFISKKGRALQMNLGALHATNNILVFLHADTLLPNNVTPLILNALNKSDSQWGRFNVKFNNKNFIMSVIALLMNIRSCVTGIVTGDQTLFVKKELFNKINGYKEIPLMEDIELSKSLKKYSKPICLSASVISSSRRWETNGYLRTILLMWKLRFLYFFGVSANRLVRQYYS